jgi:hypothetical protein
MGNTLNARFILLSGVACAGLLCASRPARAFDYEFDNGVDVRFDNTIQYSATERVAPLSQALGGQTGAAQNTNDGDDNLRAGIVSNRVDLLTKFDISDNGYGFDTTIDSFYDTIYNQKTQNTNGATYNPAQQPADKFTSATQTQAGRNIELRNLFVYGTQDIDGVPVTLRVGRLVNLFGESLFFAGNGIAYGMAPVDVERASSVPNTQAKDLFLPVGQALITAQVTNSVSVSAYYQFEWEKFNFIPAGSYFSTADLLDEGAQRLYADVGAPYISPARPGSALYFYRANDIKGKDTGQFGLAVHYAPVGSSWDYGFYALQYNDSQPQIYTEPHFVIINHVPTVIPTPVSGTAPGSPTALSLGTYQTVYANGIQIYGASASTTLGPFNFAGEASVRANEDLRSTVTVGPGQIANNTNHALYAIGDVAHYQASEIYLGPKEAGFWDASSIVGEVAGENLFAITSRKENFDRVDSRHMALGLRAVAAATYFQVVSGLDLSPNIGLGWNFMGKSPDAVAFNNTGIDRGGDLTVGISGIYQNIWTGGISYTRYIAPPGRDPYADRDFVSFNVERTF